MLANLDGIEDAIVEQGLWVRFAGSSESAIAPAKLMNPRDAVSMVVKVVRNLAFCVAYATIATPLSVPAYNYLSELAAFHSFVVAALIEHPTEFVIAHTLGDHGNEDPS